jgi:protein farnesyltransferase subunit beta
MRHRGIYCLLVCATLLDLLTPELVEGTAAFIASCQTYEGGFSCASQPYFSPQQDGRPVLLDSPRPPLGEAHGGYTFCAVASWVLLQPYVQTMSNKPSINTQSLLRWLVHMQGIECELGGFKGRTNKLVDGCYSWWVGGAFSLLEVLGVKTPPVEMPKPTTEGDDVEWDDVDGEDAYLMIRFTQSDSRYKMYFSTGMPFKNISFGQDKTKQAG